MNKIELLQVNKTVQYIYIPTKVIKKIQIVSDFIFSNLNDSITQPVTPTTLKLGNFRAIHKKVF